MIQFSSFVFLLSSSSGEARIHTKHLQNYKKSDAENIDPHLDVSSPIIRFDISLPLHILLIF
jgi:hypothetical protein